MDTRNLGQSGLQVSRICLGMMSYGNQSQGAWVLSEDESKPFLKKAVDHGINFFDTADAYSQGASEEILGRAIGDLGLHRDSVVIATKVYFPTGSKPNQRGLSKKHIRHAIDNSLMRLGLDYVDLYQIHRFDIYTPIEETLEALDDVVREGKALHIGASSMYAWQFMKALSIQRANGWAQFRSMQNFYNLAYREEEREMIPLCISEGIGVIPWSPLARGFLAGSRKADGQAITKRAESDPMQSRIHPSDYGVLEAVTKVAQARNLPNAQIALAWLASRPGVTAPIVGATKPHHLDDAVAALSIKLTDDEIAMLEKPYQPHPVIGHSYEDTAEQLMRMRQQAQARARA
ncbi:MAG: aldo/keto reductase [Hyphomonadaceae bacterium]